MDLQQRYLHRCVWTLENEVDLTTSGAKQSEFFLLLFLGENKEKAILVQTYASGNSGILGICISSDLREW